MQIKQVKIFLIHNKRRKKHEKKEKPKKEEEPKKEEKEAMLLIRYIFIFYLSLLTKLYKENQIYYFY